MDEYECKNCKKSMMGFDGICMNCGWDEHLDGSPASSSQEEEESEGYRDGDTISLEDLLAEERANEDD